MSGRRGARIDGVRSIDASLVRRARAGDPAAAAKLFERHWPTAWRVAFALTRDRGLADDAAQVALIRAFASLERFDLARPFAPWLNRIVSRAAIDQLRARSRWTAADGLDPVGEPIAEEPVGELGDRIAEAVMALDEDRRTVVVLRYWGDLGVGEIAALLGAPAGTVASRLSRGLAELRKTMEEGSRARPGV